MLFQETSLHQSKTEDTKHILAIVDIPTWDCFQNSIYKVFFLCVICVAKYAFFPIVPEVISTPIHT